jgi:HKD family nuclease
MNLNYVIASNQDINKLLATRFIQHVEKATWLSPIVVAFKKNGKLKICVDFRKLNAATKKCPYPFLLLD